MFEKCFKLYEIWNCMKITFIYIINTLYIIFLIIKNIINNTVDIECIESLKTAK